jgi:hypothetical protein
MDAASCIRSMTPRSLPSGREQKRVSEEFCGVVEE